MFSLSISFWVVCGWEVVLNPKQLTEGAPEVGDEVLPAIGYDVSQYAMFREYVAKEYLSEIGCSIRAFCGNEDRHFRESIDDNQDAVVSVRVWESFDEVHADRVP